MTAPPFALPVPDPVDPPPDAPHADVGRIDRARSLAAAGALGAAAVAATLAVVAGLAVFEHDVMEVVARPGVVPWDISVAALRDLSSLPGPSLLVAVGLLPAVGLLILAAILRRAGAGAPPLHDVSVEALAAAERTLGWAAGLTVAGVIVVVVAPALLGAAGFQLVSLTSGSMAPDLPAGSLVVATVPADRAALPQGSIVVATTRDGGRFTHRVVGVEQAADGSVAYRTKGDAVAAADPEPLPASSVEATAIAGFPLLGAIRAWLASPLGLADLLVFAGALSMLAALLADDRRRAEAAHARRAERGPVDGPAILADRRRAMAASIRSGDLR